VTDTCLVPDACTPHDQRCLDDDRLEVCNEDCQWQPGEDCSPENTGRQCWLGTCKRLCEIAKEKFSYMGCDYWAADLDNAFVPGGPTGYYDAADQPIGIIVYNPSDKYASEVTLTDSDGLVAYDYWGQPMDMSPILPDDIRVFHPPQRNINGTVLAPLAFRIESSIPVVAYQLNPYSNVEERYSNDGTLLLPTNGLHKEYIVMTRQQSFDILRGFLTVVGTRANTTVSVTVTADTLAGNGIPAMTAGESFVTQLGPYDVLNIETNKVGADLTGTRILASRSVAVFAGSEAANAPKGVCCADHLESQLYPVAIWDTHYVATHSQPRGSQKDFWRIVAAHDNTVVTTFPPQAAIPVLQRGEWVEFESDQDFEIIAKKPVMVGQFLASAGASAMGDPAFILAVPHSQNREFYGLVTPPGYALNFLNITAPLGATVLLDGVELPQTAFEPVGTGQFAAVRWLVDPGVHRIVTDGSAVGVTAYGFDEWASYGYAGGLNVKTWTPPDDKSPVQ